MGPTWPAQQSALKTGFLAGGAARGDFAYAIQVKGNAPELLCRALSRLPVDLVMTGDYQAGERKSGASRRMREVCLELGFPVSVLECTPWKWM